MSPYGLTPVFGAANFGTNNKYGDEETIEKIYKILETHECKNIDTARLCKRPRLVLLVQ
jgi:hypothetical protein